MTIPSMLRFPSFLTISYRFPWCFHMFPLVFLRFSVFLLFPPSVSPVSYFRFCGNNYFAVTSIFLYSDDCFNIEMNTLISSSTITYLILHHLITLPIPSLAKHTNCMVSDINFYFNFFFSYFHFYFLLVTIF